MLACLRSTAPALVALLCLIVLAVRLSGTHAHLNLPTAAGSLLHEQAHLQHGHRHDDHTQRPHLAHAEGQVDVSVNALIGGSDPRGKPGSVFAAALLLATLLCLRLPRCSVPWPSGHAALRHTSHLHWRPPLRGPPQVSVA